MTTDEIVKSLYICARECNSECAIDGDPHVFCEANLKFVAAGRLKEQDKKIRAQAAEITLLKDALEKCGGGQS